MKKVIVIGLDGLEPRILEGLIAKGELPNINKVKNLGGYCRLGTTYPAQTPVAWSTFTTGTNPGGHGIFDFLHRDPQTYLPILSLSKYQQKNAFVPPKVVNMRQGTPFWSILTAAGIPSIIIRCACTYPPDEIKGRMLSGVGVPDLRGSLGISSFYTTSHTERARQNEKLITVNAKKDGGIDTSIIGPRDPKTSKDFRFNIHLKILPQEKKVVISSRGRPETLDVREGQWSEWLKVRFKLGFLQSVSGIVRFYLKECEPIFQLYASPVNFDAEAPLFPISQPVDYASELETRLGTYYTAGMAEDHDGLINDRFDEISFLDQCQIVFNERKNMMFFELERFDQGFFFCLYDTPDRLQHMFWRYLEADHPANRSELNKEMAGAINAHYRECDSMIGEVMKYGDSDTLLIVLSDHGMTSFQRGFNLNTWLHENGFLALKKGNKPGEDQIDFFRNVDWDRTQAYALGLGGIYLNIRGREINGIVDEEDAYELKRAISKGLHGFSDPERGQVAVRSVVSREQVYSGPYTDLAPDLLLNFAEGYRVSWDTPLGGVPNGLFCNNIKKWGGDHVADPSLVPGVLCMNRRFNNETPNLVDMAPTILAAFGLDKGADMEGRDLFS